MLTTKRKPATVGEILTEEFMQPMGLTQGALAEAMGVQRKHVNELCGNRRNVTAATALILARVFGTSPDFWLNVQRRSDLWEVMNTPKERERIERALISTGYDELLSMIEEDHGAEVTCRFCDQVYPFSEEDLRALLEAATVKENDEE